MLNSGSVNARGGSAGTGARWRAVRYATGVVGMPLSGCSVSRPGVKKRSPQGRGAGELITDVAHGVVQGQGGQADTGAAKGRVEPVGNLDSDLVLDFPECPHHMGEACELKRRREV